MDARNEPGRTHLLHPAGLTPLDVAAGGMLGTEHRDPLPKLGRKDTLDSVFEAMIMPALESERCLVSFSGGRDSSWVLAATTMVARRHGLPDPVPITFRTTGIPEAEETSWQEEVLAFLELKEWERIDVTDELNLVGPWAQTALRRHGRLFPASCFMLLPMFERAGKGTLVVAQGGEEMYIYWRWARLVDLLNMRVRPRRRDLRLLALALAPLPLRRRLARRSAPPAPFPWLREPAARAISDIFAEEVGTEPIRYNAALRGLLRHRCMSGTIRSVNALAAGTDASVLMPAIHPGLLAVWARDGGWKGWGDRTTTMRKLAGHLLPDHVLARRDKTRMNRAFFGPHTRAFAERWSGGGVDPSLVDVQALRQVWLDEEHDWRTALLIQAAWLHDERERQSNGRSSHGKQAALAGA